MRTIGLRYLTGICLAGLFCLSSAFGQTVTGSITGEVTDPSGAVVVGATVTAENTATSVKTTARRIPSACIPSGSCRSVLTS